MERLSVREKERIAELLGEGAPFWRLRQEVPRSRHADRSGGDGDSAAGEAGTEPVAVAAVVGGAGGDLAWDRVRRFVAVDRVSVGSFTVDGVA